LLYRFIKWIKGIFSAKTGRTDTSVVVRKPPISFSEITVVGRTPRNSDVKPGTFYMVDSGNKPKWAMFLCPCGCEHVITLSLQKVHDPHWQLNISLNGYPTLRPSVWQKTKCYSHFWLREGRIYWCEGTGSPSSFW